MKNSILTFTDDLNLISKLSNLGFNVTVDDEINNVFLCVYKYNDYLDLLGRVDDLIRDNISNEFQITYKNKLYSVEEFLNKFER